MSGREVSSAVLFHDSCPDGWTAAWVAAKALGVENTTLIPVTHGDPPPELAGIGDVFIVDFSYEHDTLVELTTNHQVVVLDHHQLAIDKLRTDCPYETVLDVERSGASIAWDYFNPGAERSPVVDYVEDRDLWRWSLPNSKTVNAYIKAQPHTIDAWDALAAMSVNDMHDAGVGALTQVDAYCRAAASHAYMCRMGDREFPIVNVTYESCSDVASYMIETLDAHMVGYFFERGQGGWQYGFRSRKGVTVHDFAQQFGGGGHPQASGCVVDNLVHDRLAAS